MPCACQSKRQQYEVVTKGGEGKVVFTSSSKPTANAVSRRYADSIVREKAKPGAKPPAGTATTK